MDKHRNMGRNPILQQILSNIDYNQGIDRIL